MSTKLTTDQIAGLRALGATAFKRQQTSPPRNEGISIVEMNYWTDGWLQAQQFAERQKALDLERKIAEVTRYSFFTVGGGISTVVRNTPGEVVDWAKGNKLTGWVVPVVGDLVTAKAPKKVAKTKTKTKTK